MAETTTPDLNSLKGRATCTVEEACEVLGIGLSLGYGAVSRGEIPSIRMGRKLLVPVPKLLAMLEES
jgi:excisionase family DNA binding protein